MCAERDITDVDQLNEQGKISPDTIKKLPTYHAVIFMRNETGGINLYKLVSQSHIKYFNHRPQVAKEPVLRRTGTDFLSEAPARQESFTRLFFVMHRSRKSQGW